MNKFLWSLFGIGEDEVPDLSRRGFLLGAGAAAAVVVAAGPKYFLPPAGGWRPGALVPADLKPEYQFGFTGWNTIDAATNDYIVPVIADIAFKPSPLFTKIHRRR